MKKEKKVSALDVHIMKLELEKSKLNRERSTLVLNKGVFLYFTFMFIGVVGFTSGYIKSTTLNWVVVGGICCLLIGAIPYIYASQKEQKNLNTLLNSLKKQRGY
jgi:hypothetical protein